MKGFKELGVIEPVLRVIEEEKYENPSLIQEKAIPFVLAGKDIVAGSATGSGKTLVFGAGIIQNCEAGKGIQSLILAPTRELAKQICDALNNFSKYKPLKIIPVYGGVSINPQIAELRAANVVVGTPGRILDHISRYTINLASVKILVLDEADRMFDMGFLEDVEKIILKCPDKRQTLLFSATINDDVYMIAKRYMKNPSRVSGETQVDPTKLKQVYYDVPENMKFSLLVHLLKNEKAGLVMIFCNSRQSTNFVAGNLENAGINAQALHGGFSQEKRDNAMSSFHSKNVMVLVCTDVAARGLDIKGVSHVYNYELPKDSIQYVHRIGRTARAGEDGKAISLLSRNDYENFSRVIKENKVKILKEAVPEIERIAIKWEERPMQRNFARPQQRFGTRRRGWVGR